MAVMDWDSLPGKVVHRRILEGLPKYFVLQSTFTNHYLRYEQTSSQVFCDGNDAGSPYSKFESEPARKEANHGLFHIRCCHNNRYITRRSSAPYEPCFASAKEAVEDQSHESCTLFRPLFNAANKSRVMLRHVKTDRFVYVDSNYTFSVGFTEREESVEEQPMCKFSVLDWDSLMILPEKVAFKGEIIPPFSKMQGGLPMYFVLQSTSNRRCYLRYYEPNEQDTSNSKLSFDEKQVICHYSKFEFEPAAGKEANQLGLYHIRCCHNNRYLTTRYGGPDQACYAEAKEAVEDQSQDSCTLFQPLLLPDKSVSLRHVGSNRFVYFDPDFPTFYVGKTAEAAAVQPTSKFSVIDWDSLVILPEKVVFKGDNGRYLGVQEDIFGDCPYLKFDFKDIADARVSHRLNYNDDGTVCIQSDHNNMFWRLHPERDGLIMADAAGTMDVGLFNKSQGGEVIENINAPVTVFRLVRGGTGDNLQVGLVNVANGKFCSSRNAPGSWSDRFRAHASQMIKEATLTVEEPVLRRTIYNVVYRTDDARIYDAHTVSVVKETVRNILDVPITSKVSHKHAVETTTSWTDGTSIKTGVSATIEASIPKLGELGKFAGTWSRESETSHQWGESKTVTDEVETSGDVPVPPKSVVEASMVATIAKCDVPFSYMRKDVYYNGKQSEPAQMHDGMFMATSSFNFTFEVTDIKPI